MGDSFSRLVFSGQGGSWKIGTLRKFLKMQRQLQDNLQVAFVVGAVPCGAVRFGGKRGIRTPGTVTPYTAFRVRLFDHSASFLVYRRTSVCLRATKVIIICKLTTRSKNSPLICRIVRRSKPADAVVRFTAQGSKADQGQYFRIFTANALRFSAAAMGKFLDKFRPGITLRELSGRNTWCRRDFCWVGHDYEPYRQKTSWRICGLSR